MYDSAFLRLLEFGIRKEKITKASYYCEYVKKTQNNEASCLNETCLTVSMRPDNAQRAKLLSPYNPRPHTVFRHLRSDRVRPPLGISKRSVVELSGKDQQIALAEYSRLVVLFLVLGQCLTQLWQVKGQIFGNSMIF